MVPVMIATTGAAAAAARAELRHLDAFRLAGATSAERACALESIGMVRDTAFARLTTRGVLKPGTNGRYYLDEAALIAHRDRRVPRSVVVTVALVTLLLVGLALVLRLRGAGADAAT